jgi:GNAT superfamily N-acetyltransferase
VAQASQENYRWKFHGFPSVPPSYEYMATEDGKMIGYYAAIPFSYAVAGEEMRVGMACDVMTHSSARGKGIFTKLGRYALAEMQADGLDFMTGYPIRPGVMGGHLRVGWQVAFELPMYLRPLKTNAILSSKHLGWLAPLANVGAGLYQRTLNARGARGYETSTGPPSELLRTGAFDEFVERWSTSVPNHLVKSPEFYTWRLGAPGASYQAFLISDGGTLVAAAVGRQAELQGIPSFALLDLMVAQGQERALAALFTAIDREARRCQAEAVVTMMSKHSARRNRLVRFGFLKSPFRFKLIVRSLSDAVSADTLSAEEDWHLMWIDSDDL